MAFLNGTASDHVDYLSQLRTFILANGWNELAWDGTTLCVMGTGDNGDDEIFLELGLNINSSTDTYNLTMRGAAGFHVGETNFDLAPIRTSTKAVALWSNAMPFTFVADGRRIINIASVGSKMFAGYSGLLRPIGTNEQIPYPLFLAGTHYLTDKSHTDTTHKSPWSPNSNGNYARVVFRTDGTFLGYNDGGINLHVHPWTDDNWGSDCGEVFGGGLVLRPSIVYANSLQYTPTDFNATSFGHMDGVFHVQGLGQIGGSTVIIGGDTYLLCQSGAANGYDQFAAIKLA